jgi:hypothetical protein
MRSFVRNGVSLCALAIGTVVATVAWADDASLMTQLGLMRGHLFVGMEVSKAGDAKQASLHFHHPLKEIYAGIEADLKAHNVEGLNTQLAALEAAGDGQGDVKAAYDGAVAAIGKAEDALGGMKSDPKFVIATAMAMLDQAASEYAAAYPADKLAELEEYQDSMGFVMKADALIDTVSDKIKGAGYEAMDADILKLKTAWPSVTAPEKPVIDAAGVAALVAKIKTAAAAL